jgi:putative ABC transport system permease protein
MRGLLTQLRRAPGRILATLFALTLAVGAIGVLAIPTVSEHTLHEAATGQGLPDVVAPTTPLSDQQIAAIRRQAGVAAAEGEVDVAVDLSDGERGRLVGLAVDRSMNLLQIDDGRDIAAPGEAVTDPSVAAIGDTIEIGGSTLTVVGHGSTLWWADVDGVVFTELSTARALSAEGGTNRLVLAAVDDGESELRTIAREARSLLAADGDTYTEFPTYLPDGSTPVDADISQVSQLIGMLGVVAGIVALVLLASTTSTLITERTREVAVMRALGGRQRPLRRRLRRIAITIAALALLIGLPLGVLISNLIARMVLEEFVGVTPEFAVDWRVLLGSAVGILVGARLVAARAARSVARRPLAEALRDREGLPFGRSFVQRALARIPAGGLMSRLAARATWRRPGRTVAVVAQIATAVGAAFLVPSLVESVNGYNSDASAPWQWEQRATAEDPGLPFPQSLAVGRDAETGVSTYAELADWEVEVFGLVHDTAMFDPMLVDGRWIEPSARELVVSAGIAEREEIEVGELVELELASGPVRYRVVGLSDDHGVAVYGDRADIAADLGSPAMANIVWSTSDLSGIEWPSATDVDTMDDVIAADGEGRAAIVVIFGAVGAIVAGVAALAVLSSMSVSLYERRHEFATLQALGAPRRRLRRLLARELFVVGAVGVVGGLALGALGCRGIIASFETSNAVDIDVVDATAAIPVIIAVTGVSLLLLAATIVRSAARRPVAVTLRGAA